MQEDYKQAIQLAINEQRKKIRLNQRLHNMEKEAAALKTRAKSLLNFCRSKSDAHQTDDTDAADADHLSRADGKRNPHTKTSPGSGDLKYSVEIHSGFCKFLLDSDSSLNINWWFFISSKSASMVD